MTYYKKAPFYSWVESTDMHAESSIEPKTPCMLWLFTTQIARSPELEILIEIKNKKLSYFREIN